MYLLRLFVCFWQLFQSVYEKTTVMGSCDFVIIVNSQNIAIDRGLFMRRNSRCVPECLSKLRHSEDFKRVATWGRAVAVMWRYVLHTWTESKEQCGHQSNAQTDSVITQPNTQQTKCALSYHWDNLVCVQTCKSRCCCQDNWRLSLT